MRNWMTAVSFMIMVGITALAGNVAAEGPHSLEASLMYYYFDYKEDLPSPFKSTESGWLPGISLAYAYRGTDNPVYGRLLFEYTDAETDYDGTTQSGVPLTDTTDNKFLRWEGNIGYTFIRQEGFDLTAYTGLGYRYWERGVGGQAPYSEEYSWKYVPVGLRAGYRFSDRWDGALDLSARIMLDGEIKVNLSDIDPLLNNPKEDLGNKTGWKVEAPFYYKLTSPWSLVFTPWYEYSAIGKSDDFLITYAGTPVALGYEPESRTNQYGVNMGVKLRF